MLNQVAVDASETLEVDVDHFTALYAMAVQGRLSPEEEDEVLEVASVCMASEDLDMDVRDFFQSAFLVLNKKNKRFIDVRKMNQMARRGELGLGRA
jgi:hypothetical protein